MTYNLIFIVNMADNTIKCYRRHSETKEMGETLIYREDGIRPCVSVLREDEQKNWRDCVDLVGWDD